MIQGNHSLIDSFPIDYNKFPKATNYKYVEVILNPGDYLLIPNHWSHWIFSEPYTIAINYNINSNCLSPHEKKRVNNCTLGAIGENKDNIIFDSIAKNLAHAGTYKSNYNINYKDFIYSSLNYNFNFICSDTTDVCPVMKPHVNNNKIAFSAKLEDVLNDKFFFNKYLYIGQQNISIYDLKKAPTTIKDTTIKDTTIKDTTINGANDSNNLFDIPNFDNIINDISFTYIPRLWFNFDKRVDSGLHYDKQDSILYVLTGRKKVLLSHPQFLQYIYLDGIQSLPLTTY